MSVVQDRIYKAHHDLKAVHSRVQWIYIYIYISICIIYIYKTPPFTRKPGPPPNYTIGKVLVQKSIIECLVSVNKPMAIFFWEHLPGHNLDDNFDHSWLQPSKSFFILLSFFLIMVWSIGSFSAHSQVWATAEHCNIISVLERSESPFCRVSLGGGSTWLAYWAEKGHWDIHISWWRESS